MKKKKLIIKTFDKKIKPKSQFINEKKIRISTLKKLKNKLSKVKIDLHRDLDRFKKRFILFPRSFFSYDTTLTFQFANFSNKDFRRIQS